MKEEKKVGLYLSVVSRAKIASSGVLCGHALITLPLLRHWLEATCKAVTLIHTAVDLTGANTWKLLAPTRPLEARWKIFPLIKI